MKSLTRKIDAKVVEVPAEGVALNFTLCVQLKILCILAFTSIASSCVLCALSNHLSGTKMLIWSLYFFFGKCSSFVRHKFRIRRTFIVSLCVLWANPKIIVKVFSHRRFCSFFHLFFRILFNCCCCQRRYHQRCQSSMFVHFALFLPVHLKAIHRSFYSIYSAYNSLTHIHKSAKCSEYYAIFYREIS